MDCKRKQACSSKIPILTKKSIISSAKDVGKTTSLDNAKSKNSGACIKNSQVKNSVLTSTNFCASKKASKANTQVKKCEDIQKKEDKENVQPKIGSNGISRTKPAAISSSQDLEFVADEAFRQQILSGKEAPSSSTTQSSDICERFSFYQQVYRSDLPLNANSKKNVLKIVDSLYESRRSAGIKPDVALSNYEKLSLFQSPCPTKPHPFSWLQSRAFDYQRKAESEKKVTFGLPATGSEDNASLYPKTPSLKSHQEVPPKSCLKNMKYSAHTDSKLNSLPQILKNADSKNISEKVVSSLEKLRSSQAEKKQCSDASVCRNLQSSFESHAANSSQVPPGTQNGSSTLFQKTCRDTFGTRLLSSNENFSSNAHRGEPGTKLVHGLNGYRVGTTYRTLNSPNVPSMRRLSKSNENVSVKPNINMPNAIAKPGIARGSYLFGVSSKKALNPPSAIDSMRRLSASHESVNTLTKFSSLSRKDIYKKQLENNSSSVSKESVPEIRLTSKSNDYKGSALSYFEEKYHIPRRLENNPIASSLERRLSKSHESVNHLKPGFNVACEMPKKDSLFATGRGTTLSMPAQRIQTRSQENLQNIATNLPTIKVEQNTGDGPSNLGLSTPKMSVSTTSTVAECKTLSKSHENLKPCGLINLKASLENPRLSSSYQALNAIKRKAYMQFEALNRGDKSTDVQSTNNASLKPESVCANYIGSLSGQNVLRFPSDASSIRRLSKSNENLTSLTLEKPCQETNYFDVPYFASSANSSATAATRRLSKSSECLNSVSTSQSDPISHRESISYLKTLWPESSLVGTLMGSIRKSKPDNLSQERGSQFSLPETQTASASSREHSSKYNGKDSRDHSELIGKRATISSMDSLSVDNSSKSVSERGELQAGDFFDKRSTISNTPTDLIRELLRQDKIEEDLLVNLMHSTSTLLRSGVRNSGPVDSNVDPKCRESIYCLGKLSLVPDPEKKLARFCTPQPISSQLRLKTGGDVSPELFGGRPSTNLIGLAPIHTPLVLRTLAKNIESPDFCDLFGQPDESSLSPDPVDSSGCGTPEVLKTLPGYSGKVFGSSVSKKLVFEESSTNDSDSSRDDSQKLHLQSVVTHAMAEELLADREVSEILFDSDFPVVGRGRTHLVDPVAAALQAGDEMHFVPIRIQ